MATKKKAQATQAPARSVDAVGTIHTRAMLVSVSISTWTARRYDQKVSEEVNRDHGATPDAGRYNKHLFGGKDRAKSHAAAVNAGGAARAALYKMTLPWTDDGWRLLPNATYFDFQKAMREQREKFEAAAVAFVKEYPLLRSAARDHLNGLYNDAEYPSQEEVARKFRFNLDFQPVPAASDFRLTLPDDQMKAIEASVTERVQRAVQIAMRDVWERLYHVVANYERRLKLEPKNRQKMVNDSREIIEVLKRLNVSGDPELDSMIERVEKDIVSKDPVVLKENEEVRNATIAKAEEIMSAMAAFYTPEEG